MKTLRTKVGTQSTLKSGSLAAYIAANKRDTRLTGHVERYLLKQPPDDRPVDVLHPSEMSHGDWCALDNYHRMIGTVLPDEPDVPGMRLKSIFAEGHTIHHKWQTWIRNMGHLYGVWVCTDCMLSWWDTSPQVCTGCKSLNVKYAEVPLLSEPRYRIAGHADGWVTGLGKPFVIEIKSIGIGTFRMEDPKFLMDNENDLDKAWRSLRRPFPSHRRQAQIYLTLLHQMQAMGMIAASIEIPEEAVFIYELKANQDYKEFTVTYDPDTVADRFDLALDIDYAIRSGNPPRCNIGPTCKKCAPYLALVP